MKDYDPDQGDSYYRAVLQNLFFATLNTEIHHRGFSSGGYETHRDPSNYRYKAEMSDPDALLARLAQTPFINGGLFDCLDSFEGTRRGGYRIDCFTDNINHPKRSEYRILSIPNQLFFGQEKDDEGLITIFDHYKFTVEENTPAEQEVALDPELLGKVFENLLATYNPETRETARKQTGSYYTPRAVVDYMVDEALVASLAGIAPPFSSDAASWQERLRNLLDFEYAFDESRQPFDDPEKAGLVRAIAGLKVIDPAVGSGAFPMGVLHKLTLALRRLDPENRLWEDLQKELASQRAAGAFDTVDQRERDDELQEISETFEQYRTSNFGRKLYVIQNSIFGVDIQPVACQIAKLRFFISLAIEQQTGNDPGNNYGIRPLPNLETRFVAANTLLALQRQATQLPFGARNNLDPLFHQLNVNREKHFLAASREKKNGLKREDKRLRESLAAELKTLGVSEGDANKVSRWDPYDQNESARWFDPEYMFGVSGGFDLVIGNPPYGAKIDQDDLKKIRTNIKDTKNSNSAALFVDYSKNRFLRTDQQNGVVAFIVPKSLLFAEIWRDLAFTLMAKTLVLVDVEKAFERVKLEQVVFVYSVKCDDDFYVGRKFVDNAFARTSRIGREYPKQFEAWICDVTSSEVELGSKIASAGTFLKNISATTRGLSVQKFLTARGDLKVIGGKEINRYGIAGPKGFMNRDSLDLTNPKVQFLLQPKVISQRLVSHIQNPKPHIKITATVDRSGDILSVDTVENTVITDKEFSPFFVSSLLNSTLINWYAYRFVFCSAIRTMDLDNYYIGKIPVPFVPPERQTPIIELAEQILRDKAVDAKANAEALEEEIDRLVYTLYGLTEDEIAVVEGST